VSFNPYSPPEAIVADAQTPDTVPAKPWSVTVLQVVAALLLAFSAFGAYRYVAGVAQYKRLGVDVSQVIPNIAWRAALPLALFVLLFQLPKRTQIGRWLGVLFIASWLALPGYLFIFPAKPIGDSISNILGALIGCLLITAPFAWWLYAFGFSRKARAYFRSSARK
jgi:hypothetical protein